MYGEESVNSRLERARSILFDLLTKYNEKFEGESSSDQLKDIMCVLNLMIEVNQILDNHEARLTMIEKVMKTARDTYYSIKFS